MAKANLTLPNGTIVTIEGTADEVADLLAKVSGPTPSSGSSKKSKPKSSSGPKTKKINRKGPLVLVNELADQDFFKSKRSIGDVQKKLEEAGHIYATESLSPALLRLTRKRVLRRLKEKSGWAYVS
jgi:copper chaperone CopZ